MRLAKQADIDAFYDKAIYHPEVGQYLTNSQWLSETTAPKDDWNQVILTNDAITVLLKISISRSDGNGFSIGLFSTNALAAGRAVQFVKDHLMKRYQPRYIQTSVQSVNEKSLKMNQKLFGDPWGKEPLGAWNSKLGHYVDLIWFRKNLFYMQ